MVLCGAYTGMRLGDVSLLRWENVDLAGRELHFKTEKTGREQTIPIAEPLLRQLLDIVEATIRVHRYSPAPLPGVNVRF